MSTSAPTSAYPESLALTASVLANRVRRFRGLVIVVLAVVFGVAIGAVVGRSLKVCSGLLALIPLCGGFLFLDALSLNRWRSRLMAHWTAGRLDLDDFRFGLSRMRQLPATTLTGMLQSLPTRDVLGASFVVTPALRHALAATLKWIHARQTAKTIAAAGAWTVATASVAPAIIAGSWAPCFGTLLIVPVLGGGMMWRALQLRRWRQETLALLRNEEVLAVFVEAAARLDWESIKEPRKRAILSALVPVRRSSESVNRVRETW